LLISYLVSIVQAHFMQRKFVWNSTEKYFQELVRFSGAYISQFVANLILLQIFVRFIGLNRSVSQVIIVLILTVVMFFVNKNGVFRAK
jgi:putative flippase GtrA